MAIIISSCTSHKKEKKLYHPVLTADGDFVMMAEPSLTPFIQGELNVKKMGELETLLKTPLEVELTEKGFVKASNRKEDEESDETNYDAVWVRDSVWVYFSLLERNEHLKAKRLLMALWDYYSTDAQRVRFKHIIANPALASQDGMLVPHIRFNSKSPNFEDVMKDGRPEVWNHRQNDAHGLFLLGLSVALEKKLLLASDVTKARQEVLNLFVPYFDAIKYWNFSDAGAWEEISKVNTSSVSLVVKALENWRDGKNKVIKTNWNKSVVDKLIKNGYARVRKNLSLGGESPDHSPYAPEYRREDAALFNLFLPMPLKDLSASEKLLALTILEKLIRPYGVIRYSLDSYQGGNYWIKKDVAQGLPELTGDSSDPHSFQKRFSAFLPNTEAQWFFDSKLSMIYLQFAQTHPQYLRLAKLHFKRALGQLTPKEGVVLGADGKKVQNFALPESINTLVHGDERVYVPSPITPLNWAKASLSMALIRLKLQIK